MRPSDLRIPIGYPNLDAGNGAGMVQGDFGDKNLVTARHLLERKTFNMLGDEFQRRYMALIFAAAFETGLRVGVGTGWRSYESQAANYARNPQQFADPRWSLHVEHDVLGDRAWAIDTVPYDTLTWCHRNALRFGLNWLDHMPNERHHVQPVEFPNGGRATVTGAATYWPAATVRITLPYIGARTLAEWLDADENYLTPIDLLAWATAKKVRVLRGDRGESVRYLQTVLGADADGIFGAKTEETVKAFQTWLGLEVDGIVGRNTWQLVDRLAVSLAAQPGGIGGKV